MSLFRGEPPRPRRPRRPSPVYRQDSRRLSGWADVDDEDVYGYAFTRAEVLAARAAPVLRSSSRPSPVVALSDRGITRRRPRFDVGAPPLDPPTLACPEHGPATLIGYPGGWVWRCRCGWRDALARDTLASVVVLHPRQTG